MKTHERSEAWDHAQGKANGDLTRIRFRVHQADKTKDLLNQGNTSVEETYEI
jgi:hypothetical protein